MLSYALAAQRAGYHDYTNDQRLKDSVLFEAKYNTPRDLRRKTRRTTRTYGRGTFPGVYDVSACFGLAAEPAACPGIDRTRDEHLVQSMTLGGQ